jgi:diguanylate cyclase (GGDEF)-like protein
MRVIDLKVSRVDAGLLNQAQSTFWVQFLCQFARTLARSRVLALSLLVMLPAHAQTQATRVTNAVDPAKKSISQFKVDVWQTEQGLPQNTAQAMAQTRSGHLWVGTTGGLARFDGIRFTTFESSAVPELIAGPIFGFMEDAEGSLWIGHGRGAARYRNGRFERAFENELVQGKRVWAFAQARDGAVWAASESGLVRWSKGKDGEKDLTKVYKEADGLPTNRLRTLDFDKDGTLWIGTTGGGLVSFAAEKFNVMNPANGFPHLEVRHVLADPAGGIWAATAGAGLVRVDRGQLKIYTTADGLPTDHLTYLARDKAGSLWIGTWGAGVSRMNDGRFTTLSTADGLAGDQIWSATVDREGSVWVGTWHGGLNRVSNRVFGVLGKPEGLSSDNARAVIHTRNGAALVSTAGGGINRVENGRITATITKKNGLATDETSSLLEDRDGAIWIGTYTEGLARWKSGKVEKFGIAQGIPNLDVRALWQDRAGAIWVGTNGGLARFNGQKFVAVRDAGAPLDGITTIFEDRSGVLWIGTTGQGLFSYRNGVFTALTRKEGLVSNWILALYEDAAGSLWIGTNGEGMNRLANGRMSAIRTSDGLWDGTTQVIIEDRVGNLWMTCNRGFFRVPRAELDAFAEGRSAKVNATAFGRGNALRSTTFAGGLQPAGSIDANGHLWFPSLKGLVIVDPARLPGSEDPPSVMIEDVLVNGVSSLTQSGIELPPGSLPLSIRYNAGTLLNADRAQFRYQMEGITQKWVEAEKNREASFPALPHGKHLFRVAASLDGARWQEAAEPLPITVKPHYYQTPWFMALAIFGVLAAAFGLLRLRTHQLHNRHAEMERVVAAKTEELRLANEHLSRLSFADALTGLANRRRLDETLETEWRRAARLRTPLAIVIVDIDAFKAYNDTLGHPEGDKCLVAVADVIRQAAGRAGDFAARYGGEEFMILIPGLGYEAALAYAEALRQACEARAIPHPASSVGPVVTISLGVAARVPSNDFSVAKLIAEADAALYRAKGAGRNRVG